MAIYSQSIYGLDRLMRKLEKFGEAGMPFLEDAAQRGTAIVHKRTLELVPVDSGNLKEHIKVSKTKKKTGEWKTNHQVIIARGAEYGVHVELGHGHVTGQGNLDWRGAKAKPFLRPAAAQSRAAVLDITIEAMNKALETLGDGK